ncbi:MAG: hypothetical protein GY822_16505 [Deltaproteobacteria bacterium]|nr:hypothetical protein [Deltaproteobacteria bacterium]
MSVAYPDRVSKIMRAIDEERSLQGLRAHAFGHRMQGQGPRYLIAKQLFHHHAKRLGFDATRMEERIGSFPSGRTSSSTTATSQ